MTKLNSRAKGRRGEREVCKLLEAYWGRVEPCRFCPTPLSGGFSTPEIRSEFKISGDLMTTARLFPFSVEVKFRQSWSLANLIAGKPSPVWGWWRQAITAAKEQKNTPLLIFRKNRYPWRILIPEVEQARVTSAKHEFGWVNLIPGFKTDEHPICILASDFLKDGPNV